MRGTHVADFVADFENGGGRLTWQGMWMASGTWSPQSYNHGEMNSNTNLHDFGRRISPCVSGKEGSPANTLVSPCGTLSREPSLTVSGLLTCRTTS